MAHSGANIELALLAARYGPCLIEAGIWANLALVGDSSERRHAVWRRSSLLQGQFRRMCVVDGLSKVFSREATAKFRAEGNLWLLVLHDCIYWHVKKFPLTSIDELNEPLPEPKSVQTTRRATTAYFDEWDVVYRQLAFAEFGYEPVVIPVEPPLYQMRPIGLWYEVADGLIAAWHLIEQSKHEIIARETIIVPLGPDSAAGLPEGPPPRPINPKYNDDEGDSETG